MEYAALALIVVAALVLVWRSLRRGSCPAGDPKAPSDSACCGTCALADSCALPGKSDDAVETSNDAASMREPS